MLLNPFWNAPDTLVSHNIVEAISVCTWPIQCNALVS